MTKTSRDTIPVAQLKAQLSQHLRSVAAGRELTITDRGRPVARLVPIADKASRSAHVEDLLATGAARAPVRALPKSFWQAARPCDPDGRSLEILLEERSEGR